MPLGAHGCVARLGHLALEGVHPLRDRYLLEDLALVYKNLADEGFLDMESMPFPIFE